MRAGATFIADYTCNSTFYAIGAGFSAARAAVLHSKCGAGASVHNYSQVADRPRQIPQVVELTAFASGWCKQNSSCGDSAKRFRGLAQKPPIPASAAGAAWPLETAVFCCQSEPAEPNHRYANVD